MRAIASAAVVAIAAAGCGGHHRPAAPRVTPTATPLAEHAHGLWSRPRAGIAPRGVPELARAAGWERSAASSVPGAAALIEWTDADRFRLRVVVGDRKLTLRDEQGDSPLDDVAIAVADDGSALVAYAEDRAVLALRVSAGGRAGPETTLGWAAGVTDVVAGVAPGGRAVVAWGTHDGGEELNQPNRFFAAVRDPGTATFARAVELDRSRVITTGTGHLRLTVNRRAALLLWNVVERAHHRRVHAARAGARNGFGPPVDLGDGTPGAAALGADGTALAAWTASYHAYAAVGPPGKALGRREAVSDADRAFDLQATFDSSGRPQLRWTTHRPPQGHFTAIRTRPEAGHATR
jgi:hypothetical protein